MSYRISLYRCPKDRVDSIRDIVEPDYSNDEDGERYDDFVSGIYDTLKYERVKYDTLTDVLDGGGQEIVNNLCSMLFNSHLKIEDDCSFYTISKEQLINIIEYVRVNNIYEPMMRNTVDYDEKVIGYEGENGFDFPAEYADKDDDDECFFNEAVRLTCMNERSRAKRWDKTYRDIFDGPDKLWNIDISDDKWSLTNSPYYEYCIFDFIHILKIFDWDNDYLIALGE